MTLRVRFAPSPTGLLHIGNARAALINWLFAHHHRLSGAPAHFLLRLDDTDHARSKTEFADSIHRDLEWLGLSYDQFIRQSDRFERYQEAKDQLIAQGRLYPCYETPEELESKRQWQLKQGRPPLYDRTSVSPSQQEEWIKEGRLPHWRFQLTDEEIYWNDLIRGPSFFQGRDLSDPVLIKADGSFLYTFCSVVDDIDFSISHILRGEDHVTNTAVQCQIFSALGRDPQTLQFGHTTLLVDQEGGPLSKRLGSLTLASLREEGVEPMAIHSLLARLGTSHPIIPFLTLEDLARSFDLKSFSRTPPRFAKEDLVTLTQKIYQLTPFETLDLRLENYMAPYFSTPESRLSLWEAIKGNLSRLEDIPLWAKMCGGEDVFPQNPLCPEIALFLQEAYEALPELPWTSGTWGLWTQRLKEKTNRHGRALFLPLRRCLTGQDHGPEMKYLLPLIGRDRTMRRLRAGLS